jgi:NAD(P)-dependent dehydrogenase (short-subunit alcohol dehydrogenase family)
LPLFAGDAAGSAMEGGAMLGRSVVITGGTGGLGVAVLRMVVSRGARVTLAYREGSDLAAAQAALSEQERSQVDAVQADVTVEDDVRRLYAAASKVEVVLHLAGGFAISPTENVGIDDWNALLALNLTSTFLMCKHALGPIRDGGYGRIVTVGARAALQPLAGAAAYAASKAGVIALTAAIAEELRGIDATANCVLPSLIDTPKNRAVLPKAQVEHAVAPESLAHVICFLGSHAAADLRGAAVPVYGSL